MSRMRNHNQQPHYLVFRAGHESYVLNQDRELIRRQASRMMESFAKAHGRPAPVEGPSWDGFSEAYGFSSEERKRPCAYSLVQGNESDHQLRLLVSL